MHLPMVLPCTCMRRKCLLTVVNCATENIKERKGLISRPCRPSALDKALKVFDENSIHLLIVLLVLVLVFFFVLVLVLGSCFVLVLLFLFFFFFFFFFIFFFFFLLLPLLILRPLLLFLVSFSFSFSLLPSPYRWFSRYLLRSHPALFS